MTSLAPTLQAYMTDRLIRQRQASPHTVAAYRDAFKLLLVFAAQRTGKPPSKLEVADLDVADGGFGQAALSADLEDYLAVVVHECLLASR